MNTKKTITITLTLILAISTVIMILETTAAAPKAAAETIAPKTIPKFTNQLITNIPVYSSRMATEK